jgi:hypothetical protein
MPNKSISAMRQVSVIQHPANRKGKHIDRLPDSEQEPRFRFLQMPVLAALLAVLTAPTLLPKYSVVDNDLWLHLKVGDWILEHKAFPHTGILSRTAGDRPWMAYSWFHEVLLSLFHSWFHLIGIAVYGGLLTVLVAYSVFWMTRRLSGSFWRSCLLGIVTCAAFLYSVFPRPVFFSMMLFTVTMTLLLEARRTGRPQLLFWLPPIFVLWANVHIQFIYGVFLVALFVAASIVQGWAAQRGFKSDALPPTLLPVKPLLMTLAACVLATCINPYTYHLYSVVFEYAKSKYPYTYVGEFQALSFRHATDFVLLLLTCLAFFALGRRKQFDAFLFALLCAASAVGFRTQRDAWFLCIPAAACLAETFRATKPERKEGIAARGLHAGVVAVMVTVLVLLYARVMDINSANLRQAIADAYPVQAVNFLRDHPQPGPLYNSYDWGDFITWYMPGYPVSIDGRTDLYRDELDTRSFMTMNADPSYADDPILNESNLVLLPPQRPLAYVLRVDPQFKVVYEDSVAVVFVRQPGG